MRDRGDAGAGRRRAGPAAEPSHVVATQVPEPLRTRAVPLVDQLIVVRHDKEVVPTGWSDQAQQIVLRPVGVLEIRRRTRASSPGGPLGPRRASRSGVWRRSGAGCRSRAGWPRRARRSSDRTETATSRGSQPSTSTLPCRGRSPKTADRRLYSRFLRSPVGSLPAACRSRTTSSRMAILSSSRVKRPKSGRMPRWLPCCPRTSAAKVWKVHGRARSRVLAEQPVDSLPHICGFRHMPSTDSDACRPLIPSHTVHRFRPMSSTLTGGHWRGFGTSGRRRTCGCSSTGAVSRNW